MSAWYLYFSPWERKRLRVAGKWQEEESYAKWKQEHGFVEKYLFSETTLSSKNPSSICYYGLFYKERLIGCTIRYRDTIEAVVLLEFLTPKERVKAELGHLLYTRYHNIRKAIPEYLIEEALEKAITSNSNNSLKESFLFHLIQKLKISKVEVKGQWSELHDSLDFLAEEIDRTYKNP